MTLDERIKFFEQEANDMERVADTGVCMDGTEIALLYADDTECIDKHIERLRNNAREYRQLAKWLKELKQSKQLKEQTRWCPVSEGLPDDSGEYIVTVIDEDVETYYRHTGIAWYAHPKDYGIEEGEWRELMINETVVAWMPKPSCYEPQESEDIE